MENNTPTKVRATQLKPGDRVKNEHGFVQEIASIHPHSTWGLRLVTTYDIETGCPSQVVDKMTKIELTDEEPHGENNPFGK